MADDPSECVFAGLVIGRAWCTAREEVALARKADYANVKGSGAWEAAVSRAVKAVDALEKEIKDYSGSPRYGPSGNYGSHCSETIRARFDTKHLAYLQDAKEAIRQGDFMAAQDFLSEAI